METRGLWLGRAESLKSGSPRTQAPGPWAPSLGFRKAGRSPSSVLLISAAWGSAAVASGNQLLSRSLEWRGLGCHRLCQTRKGSAGKTFLAIQGRRRRGRAEGRARVGAAVGRATCRGLQSCDTPQRCDNSFPAHAVGWNLGRVLMLWHFGGA